jgi:hypothetical protein
MEIVFNKRNFHGSMHVRKDLLALLQQYYAVSLKLHVLQTQLFVYFVSAPENLEFTH